MKTIKSILAAALAAFSTAAAGDPDPTRFPMDRAIERVTANSAEQPDNRGLRNARDHLFENLVRHETRGRGHEAVERPERPERPERVEVISRSDIGRAHRPERPERPGKK